MKYRKLSLIGMVSALALVSATASAHSSRPYVLPFQFHTDQDVATLYAGEAEHYFEPEAPGGAAEGGYAFTVTHPAGETHHVEYISRHKQLVLIEIDTREEGTYKVERTLLSREFPQVLHKGEAVDVERVGGLSSEERKEREARKIVDGQRQFFFEDEVKAFEIVPVRFVNHITAYVTRGKPNDAALKVRGEGFEFDFRTHPNEVSVQSGLKFVARVDGRAAAGIGFEVFRQGGDESFKTVKSDRDGLVEIRFEQPGVHVLRAEAPLESVRDGKVVNPRYINWLVVEVRP